MPPVVLLRWVPVGGSSSTPVSVDSEARQMSGVRISENRPRGPDQ
ncbi:hypothetical protein ACIBMZ_19005 [Micromonospora sp. NPDC049900]